MYTLLRYTYMQPEIVTKLSIRTEEWCKVLHDSFLLTDYITALFNGLLQLRKPFPSYRAAERDIQPKLQALPKPLTSQHIHVRQEKEAAVTQRKSRFN